MCDMCYGYIYDTLINPLPSNHLLNEHIHRPSLLRCSNTLTECFKRALDVFDNDISFFIEIEMDEEAAILSEKDPRTREYMEDAWVWKKFNEQYPKSQMELKYALDICLDHSIARHTIAKEHVIQHFLMDRLRILLSSLPDIHTNHNTKMSYEKSKSLGPVPLKKIVEIRTKLGLPVSKWERETSVYNLIDKYRYLSP
jgi:hypothetical protein